MPRIPSEVIEHHLKINPDVRPVSQKPRRQSVERQDFIRKEVQKLLDVGFITQCGWPTQSSSPRRMGSFGCASTTAPLIRLVPRTHIHFHG
jgi:hypothetical protein